MSVSRVALISEGTLTVVGKKEDGEEVTITADVQNLGLEIEDKYSYAYNAASVTFNSNNVGRKVKLVADVKGQYDYKVTPAPKGVERTARVEVEEKRGITAELITQAAEKAGVPLDTPFRILHVENFVKDERITRIEFYWTD